MKQAFLWGRKKLYREFWALRDFSFEVKSHCISHAKPGTLGRVLVFPYEAEWEGQFYQEKEVTVYYKLIGERLILLTVKARYGSFPER